MALFVFLLGFLSAFCWWQIRFLGDVRQHLGAFYGYFTGAFLLHLATLWLVRRTERESSFTNSRWPILLLIGVWAIAFRAMLVTTTPTLSDDSYRYVWDGRVQLAGIDPYAFAPDDPRLAVLRDADFPHINFPHLRTIYPPLTQRAFLLGARIAPTLTAQKVVFLGAEAVTILCLILLLRLRQASPLWVAAYAWHPLVILEIAGSGHNDSVGIACLWAGILAWQLRRRGLAAVGWGLTFLSKYAAVVLVPWWWCRGQGRRWLLLFAAVAATPIVCCPTIVSALFGSLSAMASRFESNSSIYVVLASLLHHAGAARVVVVGGWIMGVLWWAQRQEDVIRFAAGAFASAAILSPVLHPWYVVWLVPFLCVWRPPALMALTATVVLAYSVWPGYLAGGPWTVPLWVRLAEYLPVYLLAVFQLGNWLSVRGIERRVPMTGRGAEIADRELRIAD